MVQVQSEDELIIKSIFESEIPKCRSEKFTA